MTISRAELLKELLPGLNELFGMEYKSYARRQREAMGGNEYVHNVHGVKNETINCGINNAECVENIG
jgi:hypothetical protein